MIDIKKAREIANLPWNRDIEVTALLLQALEEIVVLRGDVKFLEKGTFNTCRHGVSGDCSQCYNGGW